MLVLWRRQRGDEVARRRRWKQRRGVNNAGERQQHGDKRWRATTAVRGSDNGGMRQRQRRYEAAVRGKRGRASESMISDVQGPARLKSPGPGSASVGPGFDLQRAGPLAPAQGWLGLGSASGHGFTKAGA